MRDERARALGERERRLGPDVVDRRAIEQLERAAGAALADDGAHCAPRRRGVGHDRDERAHGLQPPHELDGDLRRHAEGPLAADEERREIVARDALGRLAPEAQRLAAHRALRRRPGVQSRVTPYLNARGPPAFSATLPPHRAHGEAGRVEARRTWPVSASTAACRSALTTPGSTMAMRSSMLMSTIFFMRSVESTRPPRTGQRLPPVMPVPVPLAAVTGTLCSAASLQHGARSPRARLAHPARRRRAGTRRAPTRHARRPRASRPSAGRDQPPARGSAAQRRRSPFQTSAPAHFVGTFTCSRARCRPLADRCRTSTCHPRWRCSAHSRAPANDRTGRTSADLVDVASACLDGPPVQHRSAEVRVANRSASRPARERRGVAGGARQATRLVAPVQDVPGRAATDRDEAGESAPRTNESGRQHIVLPPLAEIELATSEKFSSPGAATPGLESSLDAEGAAAPAGRLDVRVLEL